jgi:glycine dehydrogenase subunit 2
MKTLFEISRSGRKAYTLPLCDVPGELLESLPPQFRREKDAAIPEVSEVDAVRYWTNLSQRNFHIDKGFYPLGSCTMKYNPKINEVTASLAGFADIHPLQPPASVQGALQLMYELGEMMAEVTGLPAVSFQPVAGAHGEITGLMLARAYFDHRGEKRDTVLVPDSSHGTNPASTTLSGFESVKISSNKRGLINIDELRQKMNERAAVLMLTNPNTLGLFESDIEAIDGIVHEKGGLLYLDGANLNALLGIIKPGTEGFDIVHLNLHKTFSTPHGGGGPGGGGLAVRADIEPFLPVPQVKKKDETYFLDYNYPLSIGKVHSFFGNFGVLVKAYTYMRMLGSKGLKRVSENAIINANYLKEILKERYDLPYTQPAMHEFVLSGNRQKKHGAKTLDIAKRLLDLGFHAPTVYFPLIVPEALMIEPTETESKETLDAFIRAMLQIADEAEKTPEKLTQAPLTTPVRRLNEVLAARQLKVRHIRKDEDG